MPKYRILKRDELQILEQDFVQFLVTNGIMANDWELLKIEEPEKAEGLIEMFSDIVFEKALSKIEFLSKTEATAVICIQFLQESYKIRGLIADENSAIDFTQKEAIQNAILNPPKGLKIVGHEKPYELTKNQDIFTFMQQGFEIDNGKFYHVLELSQKHTLN
jgi:hypothetical protein